MLRLLGILLISFFAFFASAQQVNLDSLIDQLENAGSLTEEERQINLVRLVYLKFSIGPEETQEWIESNIKRYSQRGDQMLAAWHQAFLAVFQDYKGESAISLSILNSVLQVAEEYQNNELQGYVLLNLGSLFSHSGNYDSANRYFEKARLKLEGRAPYFQFLLQFNFITFLTEWNEFELARVELRRLKPIMDMSAMIFYRPHYQYLSVLCEMNSAVLSTTSAAIDSILKKTEAASILNLLAFQTKASISYRSGEFPKLIKSFHPLLNDVTLLDKLSLYNRAKLFLVLAEGYDSQGQPDLAFSYVNRSMKAALKGGYRVLVGKCHLELAWLQVAVDDLSGAERDLRLAEDIFKQADERFAQSDALNLWAQIRQLQNRLDEAVVLHQKCLSFRTQLGDPFLISSSLFNLGQIGLKRQQFAEALDYFRRGIKMDILKGDNYGVSQYQFEMANAFRGLSRTDSALWYLQKSVDVASEAGNSSVLQSSYLLFSEIYQDAGNLSKALEYLQKHNLVEDQLNQAASKTSLEAYKNLVELNNREAEIEQITKIQQQQGELVKTQRVLLYFSIAGVIVAVLVSLVYFRLGKKLRALNKSNTERADQLADQNMALESALTNLKKAQEQLVISEKMAALGVMSMGVAHELNNPMNFIRGGVLGLKAELQRTPGSPQLIGKFMGVIEEGLSRSSRIIQGLSHYSHTSERMDEDCDVHLVMENCLVIIQNKLAGRIEIVRRFASEPVVIKGNSGKFHQAILNFLVNAEQAIDGSGRITLTTGIENGKTTIRIEDTGCGIPEENLRRLGDLFFTTKEPGKGTGFGLSLCYKVIRDMGGVIQVSSQVGKGTVFTITI